MTARSDAPSEAAAFAEILRRRRSVREFAAGSIEPDDIRRLLWAAQGVTDLDGRRTAPSAGALYAVEVYAVSDRALLHYEPAADAVTELAEADCRRELLPAVRGQGVIVAAPLTIILAGVAARLEPRFGQDSNRYLWLEVGHAAQNVLLQAVTLGLAALPLASFDAVAVQRALGLPVNHVPIELVAVGRAAAQAS